MGKKCSLQSCHVLVLVLLLLVFLCLSQSAPFSLTGKTEHTNENSHRRFLYQPAKPAAFKVKVGGVEDKEKERTHLEGRRLSIYFPNAGIRTKPSQSGQGGGRIPGADP